MTAPEASFEPDFASQGSPRHKVRPSITGWAQVNGFRGETDTVDKMVERVAHDLEYIPRWSFGFDLRIIWLTVLGRGVRQNAY
jgi:putative colanic acid biosynthesis UDP-glucose lipid carrier transferase